jgi:hypothetical protein
VRPFLDKTLHQKGLVEWLKVNKVKALSSSPSTEKKKKKRERHIFTCIEGV